VEPIEFLKPMLGACGREYGVGRAIAGTFALQSGHKNNEEEAWVLTRSANVRRWGQHVQSTVIGTIREIRSFDTAVGFTVTSERNDRY
jgi:hypothetical protein